MSRLRGLQPVLFMIGGAGLGMLLVALLLALTEDQRRAAGEAMKASAADAVLSVVEGATTWAAEREQFFELPMPDRGCRCSSYRRLSWPRHPSRRPRLNRHPHLS